MRSRQNIGKVLFTTMYPIIFCVLQLVWLVTSNAVDSERYLIDSRPIHFVDEPKVDSLVVNSTLLLKKKTPSIGPVYFNTQKPDYTISNHHGASGDEVVWRPPHTPLTQVISNHKGTSHWSHKWFHKISSTTPPPKQLTIQLPDAGDTLVINNHQSNKFQNFRPQRPLSVVSVMNTSPTQQTATDVLGDRVKRPDVVKSATINVFDAPNNLKTTIKHNKIIVIQKRTDKVTSNHVEEGSKVHTAKPNKTPHRGNFSVAPVMDPWSNIPFPSRPSWVPPVKGGVPQPAASQPTQTVVPNLPFMPFLSSLIMPLLSKPLTPSAMNSGMQGIKAMQGFLRNSLMGAMFCFLPSAFIALSLTATQRTEVRKTPEMDDMIFYCKKCLENLKKFKEYAYSKEPNWLNENS